MGCSSSIAREKIIINSPQKNTRKEDYLSKADSFTKVHKKFKEEVLNKAFMDDLDRLEQNKNNIIEGINKMWKKHKNLLIQAQIDRDRFFLLIYEIIAENIIKTKFNYEELDGLKFLKTKLKEKFPSVTLEDFNNIKDIIVNKEGCFPRNQKALIYYTDLIQEEIQPFWKSINSNILFNKEIQVNALTICLTPSLISKENIMDDLVNIIEFNENLYTLNILLCPMKLDGKYLDVYNLNALTYKYLYKIFQAVRNNQNIKVLFFHSVKNYGIVLPPEINNLILEKVKEDTLFGLHFGKFNFSDDFSCKLFDDIVLSKNLCYLGYDTKLTDLHMIEHLKISLTKNKSLSAIILAGVECENEKKIVEDFRNEVLQNRNVKFFYYDKNLNLV
jgi:hypothetical protein